VTKKLPERLHRELKARYWRILDEAASVAEARAALLALAGDYRAAYPSAMAVIERDLDALVCHLRFPAAHCKRIRSTNLLERTFRRSQTADEGERPLTRRNIGALPDLGRARAFLVELIGFGPLPLRVDSLGWTDSEMCRQVRLIWLPSSCRRRGGCLRGCGRG